MKNQKNKFKYTVNCQIIFDYMKQHNLSKKQFAERCKISVNSLNKVLRGFDDLSFKLAYNLLNTLKFKAKDLLNF